MSTPLPLDPTFHTASLPNGFTYFVRQNTKPANRAELRLIVAAGSVLETDEERGVAHICEHLAFRHTQKYNKFELVKFLESIGARFGACQNAYTSFAETVYELHVPTDKPELLAQSLSVLQQFATDVVITDEDVNEERKVVLEEWRQNRSAASRCAKSYFKDLLSGSQYEKRLPIGTRRIIETVPASVVRAFYQRWYHPERMTIVAVGDFDATETVQLVRDTFGAVAITGRPGPLNPIPCPTHNDLRLSVLADPEAMTCEIGVNVKSPATRRTTEAEFREHIVNELFHASLNVRLQKIALHHPPPFVAASSAISQPVPTVQTVSLQARVLQGGALSALEAMLDNVSRVALHGLDPVEVELCKTDVLASMETLLKERDQEESDSHCARVVEHVTTSTELLDANDEVEITKRLLKGITAEEVSAVAACFDFSSNTVVKIVCPTSTFRRWLPRFLGGVRPVETVDEIAQVFQRAAERRIAGDIEPYEQMEVRNVLLEAPSGGIVVSERTLHGGRVGEVHEMTFANGLRVCLKHTDHLDDDICIVGRARGGYSEVPEHRVHEARLSTRIAEEIGVFGVSPEEMTDVWAGKRANCEPSVSTYNRDISANGSPDDLSFIMQLIHCLFTSPVEYSEDKVETVLRAEVEGVRNRLRDPYENFKDTVNAVNSGDSYFFKYPTLAQASKMDVRWMLDFHRRCFSDPAEFDFVLVGKLDLEEAKALATTYLATIPKRDVKFWEGPPPTELTSLPWTFPSTPRTTHLSRPMVKPFGCAQVTLPLVSPPGELTRDIMRLGLIGDYIERRLNNRLRFDQSQVYSVSAFQDMHLDPSNPTLPTNGLFGITLSGDPSALSALCDDVLHELRHIAATTPEQAEIVALYETKQRAFEETLETNDFWAHMLLDSYTIRLLQGDVATIVNKRLEMRDQIYAGLTPESLHSDFHRLFFPDTPSRYTVVSLGPAWALCGVRITHIAAASAAIVAAAWCVRSRVSR